MSQITNEVKNQIKKRRTFAIISHPDAGKTTLTEKFLLYGGAINQAGSVKGKATAKHAVSDWMEIEKERGISVTSSVLQFNYDGYCINILDTPGHQDFSEDTYRTLMAADSAVMVIDASKGVEAQTRKLFKVCTMRHIPIFTFINKMDREAMEVEGVASMAGNATRELISKLGMKSLSKGVKVDVLDGIVTVSLALNLNYGYSIKDITSKVQEKVKAAIENMTGLEVADVNIRVAGVEIPEEA